MQYEFYDRYADEDDEYDTTSDESDDKDFRFRVDRTELDKCGSCGLEDFNLQDKDNKCDICNETTCDNCGVRCINCKIIWCDKCVNEQDIRPCRKCCKNICSKCNVNTCESCKVHNKNGSLCINCVMITWIDQMNLFNSRFNVYNPKNQCQFACINDYFCRNREHINDCRIYTDIDFLFQ